MSIQQLKNASFGRSKANATGSNGVGYALIDYAGLTVLSRTTTGVTQVTSGSGIYSAYVSFPDGFKGQILWDTGTTFSTTYYASENYNASDIDTTINATYNLVQSLTSSVAQTNSNVLAMTGTLNTINNNVLALTGTLSIIDNNVQNLTSSMSTLLSLTQNVSSTLGAVYYDVKFVTGAIADVAVTVDAIYSDTQTINGNLNLVKADVDFIKSIEGGRWRIVNDQMIFYKSDNSTEVARFDLYDQFGAPSSDTVFERRRA